MAQGINSKQDAINLLGQQGIDSSFLGKVSGYLNHPFAGIVANAAGVNLAKVKEDLNSLQNVQGGPVLNPPQQGQPLLPNNNPSADPLEALRAGLQQLKR